MIGQRYRTPQGTTLEVVEEMTMRDRLTNTNVPCLALRILTLPPNKPNNIHRVGEIIRVRVAFTSNWQRISPPPTDDPPSESSEATEPIHFHERTLLDVEV